MGKELDFKGLGVGKAAEIPVKGFLSTGSRSLDWAVSGKLSGGGLPLGRIVEIYGDLSTGKSLIVAHLIANAQKEDWWTFLDDSENCLEKFFAEKIGVDLDELNYINSETIQGHFARTSLIVKKIREKDSETPILYNLDSLAALSTTHERGKAEQIGSGANEIMPELNMDKKDMTKAQLVRAGMRVLGTRFMKDDVLYVVTNHTTAQIGQMYGPKTTTPGGGGVKFHASVRIELRRGKSFTNNEGVTGHEIRARVVKNKVAPPFKEATFDMFFETGVNENSGFLEILAKCGHVTESGGWWRAKFSGDTKYRKDELERTIPEILAFAKKEEEQNGN